MTGYPLRLGIVGCGAVVENMHLPASLMVPEVGVTALVDRSAGRAQSLAARFGVPCWFEDHRDLVDLVDAVLVATPPLSHAQISCELLSQGVHVLCEKPLAPTALDCQRMVDEAQDGQAILAVAHSRRFHFNLFQLKTLLDLGAFGIIQRVKVQDGYAFGWPTQTGYMFHGETASGVLLENGVHVLDALLWLLGPVEEVDYRDDALGGVESNAELTLGFACGAIAELKISRTADLANVLEVYGELGWARCDLYDGHMLEVGLPASKAGGYLGAVMLSTMAPQDAQTIMAAQLADFARSVVESSPPRSCAEDGQQVISLIERCYAQQLERPVPDKAPLPGMVVK